MRRVLIGTVVGALVVFIWGFLSWAVLGLWDGRIRGHPGGDAAMALLTQGLTEDGAYYLPAMSSREAMESMAPEAAEADMQAWSERHQKGPLVTLLVRTSGVDPMAPGTFVGGVVIDLLGACMMSAFMMLAAPSAGWCQRFAIGLSMAVFAAATSHGSNWNWFHLPDDWSFPLAMDLLAGWTLCAAVLALILRPAAATRTYGGGGAA